MSSSKPTPPPEPQAWDDAQLAARGAARLRLRPPAPYVYRSALKRGLAAGLDALGGATLGPMAHERGPIAWGGPQRIALLRLDHLGDLLHLRPAVLALGRALPRARLTLVVGPWGAPLAELFFPGLETLKVPAPWFQRPQRRAWPWPEILGLAEALKAGGFDIGLEPRGDLRHLLALRLASVPARAGFALTAGRFLLTHPAQWDPELHEQQQALSLLMQAGALPAPLESRPLSAAWRRACLDATPEQPFLPPRAARAEAQALLRSLKLKGRLLGVQAACGAASKRWPQARWAELLRRLPRGLKPVLLGSPDEVEEMRALASRCRPAPALATGRLSLGGLAAFLARCEALVSVDSGPAHIAACVGTPVACLWSGTNRAGQWAPQGGAVALAKGRPTPCEPCELPACPYGNACMERIGVDQALVALKSVLP